jgi:1-aminocyclopropane-1-carboxylate deaminase
LSPFKTSHTEALSCSFFNFNKNIDLLRDDQIHPIVSGNKWRKLKYFMDDVKNAGKQTIVTFGGAYSNHLIATAFAGNYFNVRTHGFVRGDEKRELNHYENLCLENKMTLQHVSRSDYRDKQKLFDTYCVQYPGAVFLDEGGNHPLALKGCAEILDELEKTYDHIILATGTGTTMEGLVKGATEKGFQTKIIGISALKNNIELDERLNKYPARHWQVFHDYHRGKYAQMDDELIQFIKDFHSETGIQLEPVYTGKMMMAVIDLYKKNFFKPGDKILLIHTGGLLVYPETSTQ